MLGASSGYFTNGKCDPKAFSSLAWARRGRESLAVTPAETEGPCKQAWQGVGGLGQLVTSAGLLARHQESEAAPCLAALPLPPARIHTQSQATSCVSGWEPAEAASRWVCAAALCPPLELFHLGRTPRSGFRKGLGSSRKTHSNQWGHHWPEAMRVSRSVPSQPWLLALPRSQGFGEGAQPLVFKRTGFFPALGGDSPNNRSLKYFYFVR